MTSYESLLPVAQDAIEQASQLVRTTLPGVLTAKGDRDMVSEVDIAVERATREFLREKTSSIGFLGEEEGHSGDGGFFWTLDPVDGTANFVRGLPLCAVSLALIDQRRPVLAVVDLPFLHSRYHSVEGTGAYEGHRRLRASNTTSLRDAVVAIGDYAVGENAASRNGLRLAVTALLASRVQRVRMLGSAALDLAWVADGKLDASIMLSNKPWDTAAGVLLAREAGAHVVDRTGTQHRLDSTATLAITPALVEDVLTLVRQAGESG